MKSAQQYGFNRSTQRLNGECEELVRLRKSLAETSRKILIQNIDDNLKPGCNELFGIEVTGEFVFQCYNLDSNGSLTKYREHFQTR